VRVRVQDARRDPHPPVDTGQSCSDRCSDGVTIDGRHRVAQSPVAVGLLRRAITAYSGSPRLLAGQRTSGSS
jgi:hypothetical protein